MHKQTYKHLSSEERDHIAILRAQGFKVSEIARLINRDNGTPPVCILPNFRVYFLQLTSIIHLKKIKQKSSNLFSRAIEEWLKPYSSSLKRTITYDNGSENVEHLKTNKKLGTKSYFCNPYHSWEKGAVENAVGLIRRFLPKKTDFATVSSHKIKYIESLLNNRPRKCLNYKTPSEVFNSSVALAR